jgi:7-cyano-7-deazaguanine reductase
VRYGERSIKKAKLEFWDNPAPERDYEINLSFPEFTCLCPRSGYPIYGELRKKLKPRKLEVVGDFNPRGNLKTVIRVGDRF